MLILGLHPTSGGEAWESALLIGTPADSYADESWKLLSQIRESSAKTLKCIFPGKAIRDPDAGLTSLPAPLGNHAASSQVSRRKQMCSKGPVRSGGFRSLSQHFLALFAFQPEHHAHTANMSEASGLKPSICCKKNEVFKQGPFAVGGCQVGWGLPGRLHHVEMYEQISPGLEHVL